MVGQEIKFEHGVFHHKFAYRRSLPYYRTFEITQESKGFVSSNFYGGMTVSEQFFAAMKSRVDQIGKAILTAKSGDTG
jgi:DNA-directed RNA polymerase beta' subunit